MSDDDIVTEVTQSPEVVTHTLRQNRPGAGMSSGTSSKNVKPANFVSDEAILAGIARKILNDADLSAIYTDGEFELSVRTYLTEVEKEIVKKYG